MVCAGNIAVRLGPQLDTSLSSLLSESPKGSEAVWDPTMLDRVGTLFSYVDFRTVFSSKIFIYKLASK